MKNLIPLTMMPKKFYKRIKIGMLVLVILVSEIFIYGLFCDRLSVLIDSANDYIDQENQYRDVVSNNFQTMQNEISSLQEKVKALNQKTWKV
jgi:peptidoglycan hydrolase CwlO-like protein